MKRRLFITSTGITATFISSGFASAGTLLTPNFPWRFNPDIDQKIVHILDDFANLLMINLQDKPNGIRIMKGLVSPKKIISQNHSEGSFTYESISGARVTLQTKDRMAVKITASSAD